MCRIILENITAFYYTNVVDLSLAQVSDEIYFSSGLKYLIQCFSVLK